MPRCWNDPAASGQPGLARQAGFQKPGKERLMDFLYAELASCPRKMCASSY